MLKQTERELQNTIMQFLRYNRYYVMRLNSGALRQTDARGKMYMVRLAAVGTPDVLAIKDGKVLFVEVKVGYNKPTRLQLAKMEELEQYGAKCIVAYSVEDVEEALFS